jgi:hypothetical protein
MVSFCEQELDELFVSYPEEQDRIMSNLLSSHGLDSNGQDISGEHDSITYCTCSGGSYHACMQVMFISHAEVLKLFCHCMPLAGLQWLASILCS